MSVSFFASRILKRNLFAGSRLRIPQFVWNWRSISTPQKLHIRSLLNVASPIGLLFSTAITVAVAEEDHQQKRKTKHSEANVWATKRLQSDICHIVPAISEVLLDIVDILEDACDQYIESINEELQNLETSLQRYSSTMSLNVNEEELQSLDKINNFTKEIELQRTNFQNTYRNCHEMLTSLDRFGTSTRNIFTVIHIFETSYHLPGGSSCLGTLQTEIKEVIQMLQSMELKVRQTEGRLAMAQKHFDARRRRAGDGKRKLL
ncbi:uncharacterized protein LOC135681085 isoform X1 [Rhopilema esculentum]|uniref:uncharacterized protein LOC135681085 isoform X1 n=1 Tax=Rhopilema esculentum TaxID=499914 RepID=UPI0031E345E7